MLFSDEYYDYSDDEKSNIGILLFQRRKSSLNNGGAGQVQSVLLVSERRCEGRAQIFVGNDLSGNNNYRHAYFVLTDFLTKQCPKCIVRRQGNPNKLAACDLDLELPTLEQILVQQLLKLHKVVCNFSRVIRPPQLFNYLFPI